MEGASLSPERLDLLREVSNIGAGNAATALAKMLGEVISLSVPEVRALALRDVPDALGGAERLIAAVHVRVLGDARGNLLLTLPPEAAAAVLARLGIEGTDVHALSPFAASALRETGNILAATYLTALSRLLHVHLAPSVPGLAVDMAGAVVDLLLSELGQVSQEALVLETRLEEIDGPVRASFLLLPHPEAVPTLAADAGRPGA